MLAPSAALSPTVLAVLVGVLVSGGCGSAEGSSPRVGSSQESGSSRGASSPADTDRRNLVEVDPPGSRPNPEVRGLVQTAVEGARPGGRATLLSFPGVGRLVATCGKRPTVAFRVGDKTATVGVDTGRGMRVDDLHPGERMRTRPRNSAGQRWHIASSHGDGNRIVTASLQVAPVIGGRGNCHFNAQSLRTGRIP